MKFMECQAFIILIKFRICLAINYSNKLLFTSFLSSSSEILIICMVNCLILSHNHCCSVICCCFFFSDFSLYISVCIDSVSLSSSSIIVSSSVSSHLLFPQTKFFFLGIVAFVSKHFLSLSSIFLLIIFMFFFNYLTCL